MVGVKDVKMNLKERVANVIAEAMEKEGFPVMDGKDFGFTKHTLVVEVDGIHVQIKPITPKRGVNLYEKMEE